MTDQHEVLEATFLERPNRFLARMKVGNRIVDAFVPNPGRMHELLIPGRQMFVRYTPSPHRRTSYDLIGLHHNNELVSIDTSLPNKFMSRALNEHSLPFFHGYDVVIPEPRYYGGRFDFELTGPEGTTIIEVKSCTLVEHGRAIFPDAPTERGTRHMENLVRSLEEGLASQAAVVFVIQRPDAHVFSSNDNTDPVFGEVLRIAYREGVEVVPITTRVVEWHLEFSSRIPYDPNE